MDKLSQVRESLNKWHVDALLITSPANRRWLSGFTGSSGMLLVTKDRAILSTDSRYWEQAERQAPDFEVYRARGDKEDMTKFLAQGEATRIGYESKHVSVADFRRFQREKAFRWRALPVTVEPFRAIKTDEELAAIRAAARITDDTVSQVPHLARPGVTEREIAWELEKFMHDAGADGPGFPIIVAGGPNSALPHHRPGDRPLAEGDLIVVDLGAAVNGYTSDLTRSFHLGESPDDTFWTIYNTALEAQIAAIEGIRPGATGKQIDAFARDIIKTAGYGDNFGHGTGHSLGLEIHEFPRFSWASDKDKLEPGMVMTVEPGIYLPGYGGVRIEDLILVTEDGGEYLSAAPKSPIIPIS